ncbi:MAG: C25 family cysteine peptidase [Kiritimatiellae bacterium]|nr:C25 family cysteine peptidase [Kiritimatiellia bacterium]
MKWIERSLSALCLFLFVSFGAQAADDLLPPMTNGVASEYAPRRAGAEVGARHRILVTNEGLYRITFSNLIAAGVSSPVGSELRLFCRTQEIALITSSAGAWDSSDYAVFFGQPHDGYWTKTNTYWLGTGGSGLRMAQRNAQPQTNIAVDRTLHWATVNYAPKNIFAMNYAPTIGDFDHWIAHNIFDSATTNLILATPRLAKGSGGTATVYLALWGRTAAPPNPDHETRFAINGLAVQTSRYDGLSFYLASNAVPQSVLSNGNNTVQLRQVFAATTDVASLQWMAVVYEASNTAVSGVATLLGAQGITNYAVTPWNTNDVPLLLDISDPAKPVRLVNEATDVGDGNGRVRWADYAVLANRYWLSAPTSIPEIAISEAVQFRDFTNTARRFDYLIISDGNLSTGAYQLAKYRARDGMKTLMVPIGSVYDEFSYGIKDAGAIKQFIGYAYHHWAQPPKYVVLVGDGNYAPWKFSDPIPVYMGPSSFEYCAQDGWFGAVDGADHVRDVQIGRFPVATVAQMTGAVARIAHYESAPTGASWRSKALYASDINTTPPYHFQDMSDSNIVANLALAGVSTHAKAYYTGANSASVIATITNVVNASDPKGPVFSVSYVGHGYHNDWAPGFNNSHVAMLKNSASQPLFAMWTCANGAFADPTNSPMAELLIRREYNRGASATISGSGLTANEAIRWMADGFYGYFTNSISRQRLGDAMDAGILSLQAVSPGSREMIFYNLFGDPAQVIRP